VHEPDPDATFVSGAAKRNPVGLRVRAEKDSTAAMEKFGLPVVVDEP